MIVFRRNFSSAFIIYGKVFLPWAKLSQWNDNDGWLSELSGLITTRLKLSAQNQYDWRNFNMVDATLTSFWRDPAQFSNFTRSIISQYFQTIAYIGVSPTVTNKLRQQKLQVTLLEMHPIFAL